MYCVVACCSKFSCFDPLNSSYPLKPNSGHPPIPNPGRPSIYRGVTFTGGRWYAQIHVEGQVENRGSFDTEEDTARTYDERAKETRDSPILNFLPDGSLNSDRKKQDHMPGGRRAASAVAAAAKDDERTVAIEEEAEQETNSQIDGRWWDEPWW